MSCLTAIFKLLVKEKTGIAMIRLKVHPENPQGRYIHHAVEVLNEGGLIVYPTDTVYGLGCN